MPKFKETSNAVIIWRMRNCDDIHSTFLKWMKRTIAEFQQKNNRFIIVSVKPHALSELDRSGVLEEVGKENVFMSKPEIHNALDQAIIYAQQFLSAN